MNRKTLERILKSTATSQGWTVEKTSSSRSSKYIYLEKRVRLVVRISDHPTSREDVISFEAPEGDFSGVWMRMRSMFGRLLQNPFTKITTRKRKQRYRNSPKGSKNGKKC